MRPAHTNLSVSKQSRAEAAKVSTLVKNSLAKCGGAEIPTAIWNTSRSQATNGDLLLTYAAVLLVAANKPEQAVRLLGKASSPLCRQLQTFIRRKQNVDSEADLFDAIAPLKAWGKTRFARWQTQFTVRSFSQMFERCPAEVGKSSRPVIMDIGTGDGALLCDIANTAIERFGIKRLRLLLVDLNPVLLQAAVTQLHENVRGEIEVLTIKSPIEHLALTEQRKIQKERPWIAIAAASLHHLRYEEKIVTLSWLRRVADNVLLQEIASDHDLAPDCSFDLVSAGYGFYSALFKNVLRSSLSKREKISCLDDFLGLEAGNLLFNSYSDRLNYHCTLPQWKKVARAAGFQRITTRIGKCPALSLDTLLMLLR